MQEVSNYIAAMNHGLKRLAGGFPLSLRLSRKCIVGFCREAGAAANALRIPPQSELDRGHAARQRRIRSATARARHGVHGDLEHFLHERTTYPALIRAALAHVQFETIHPFLDGNGRLGRLLITLMLCEDGALREPILYLSLYFKTHRARYYELLQQVRQKGDWEAWLEFFLEGVVETSEQGVASGRRLIELFDRDKEKIAPLKRAAASALRVHSELQKAPLLSVPVAAKKLGISQPTIQKSLDHLVNLGIVREVTGKRRHRIYQYTSYLKILDEGTEPLRR